MRLGKISELHVAREEGESTPLGRNARGRVEGGQGRSRQRRDGCLYNGIPRNKVGSVG